jgi:tetratricopeptide (TPR) repeat protein
MDSKLSRWCEGLLEVGWLTAVIAIPLFFNIHSDRVFEPDKLTLLRSIAVVMALAWLVKWIEQRGWQDLSWLRWRAPNAVWRTPLVLPVAALVVIYLLSALLSVTPQASWAGSYQRLQGTYTTLAYIVIFALTAATLRSRAQVRRVVTAVIITSIPVAFYGVLQHFDLDPLPWGGDVTRRVAGHMGNAIFIAAYLIMAVPLTLGRIVDAFSNILGDEELSQADVLRASIYIFTLAIQLLTIYWSGSRGPLLALAGGLFAFTLVLLVSLRNAAAGAAARRAFQPRDALPALLLLLPALAALLLSNAVRQAVSPLAAFAFFMGVVALSVLAIFVLLALRRGWRWLWLGWILLTAFVGGWLVLFNAPAARTAVLEQTPLLGGVFQTHAAWRELPTIGSYGRMLDPTQTTGREKSNRVRVLIWEGVIELISPHAPLAFPDGSVDPFNFWRPLIGYGPESMYVAYNRYYPPELATVEARNASPDRAHNETFDALVITGLLGFLAWQALYLTVFYVGFRYLGVVRSRRDRGVLVGVWVGGALLGAGLSFTLFDPIYLGVAIPTGVIAGLALYLVYYALFTRPAGDEEGDDAQPFAADRLLMNALVAAVLAHYIEIHFGIAIAATRLHFFVYLALILALAHLLPRLRATEAAPPAPAGAREPRGRRARRAAAPPPVAPPADAGLAPIWLWTLMLGLVIGILGFQFITYALPPDVVIRSGADLPAGEIFRQSLFVNARRGFVDSPFIFLMMALTWALGILLALSEMARQGEWSLPAAGAPAARRRALALGGFGLLALGSLGLRLAMSGAASATPLLGRSLLLFWVVLCLWAMLELTRRRAHARLTAVTVAMVGVAVSLPVVIAGGWLFGLATAVVCTAILFVLWERSLRDFVFPLLTLALGSFGLGLAMTWVQTVLLRESLLYLVFYQAIEPISPLFRLFFRPTTALSGIEQLRVLEALQVGRFLTAFYWFVFGLALLGGWLLARPTFARLRRAASPAGLVSLALALLIAVVAITQTNLRVVQADMVYKRGKPFDDQAARTADPAAWDVAIAIYETAIDSVPNEDFYYLFLGRAYLERATLTADAAARVGEPEAGQLRAAAEALLRQAEARLLEAQAINPLNTDHTANLARLNTRWAALATSEAERAQRATAADRYYQQALALSPQNSLIRNQYAQLVLELQQDCAAGLALYDQSLAIDPFYTLTYFARAEAYVGCAAQVADAEGQALLAQTAVDSLGAGLARDPQNPRAWLQAGQIYRQMGLLEAALEAFAQARATNDRSQVPAWNVDYLSATVYQAQGELELAREFGARALAAAPEAVAPQIQAFLDSLP